ncbi:MAG: DUF2279 domain-containing protein [Bacteroidetes bacterium]|nr:DUF2279 domain-containing protein [Bacteroidota bacterium]
MNRKASSLLCLFLLMACLTTGQTDSNYFKKRVLVTGITLTYLTGMTGLYYLWYKDYPQTDFHFFNDNREWLQMDKVGHILTSYNMGRYGYDALRWAGFNEDESCWTGGSSGWIFLASIEVMDAYSSKWGFSWGDVAANTLGTGLFLSQQRLWKEQRVILKFSFHQTPLAMYRPDLLGNQWYEQMIKDYNGQTYWLSINLHSFSPHSGWLPPWLNIALGYGAYGMLGGTQNPVEYQGNILPPEERYRRFFISPDLSLSKIKTRSKTLHSVLSVLDLIKIPLPAIEFSNKKGWKVHPLYF